jgi:hypothetical protein
VGDHREVRSGGFLAGNFRAARQGFAAEYGRSGSRTAVTIYWVPLYVDHMPQLVVQATMAYRGTFTRTSRQHLIGAGGGRVFYIGAVRIPEPGTWKLVARAGRDQGCFLVTFRAPGR